MAYIKAHPGRVAALLPLKAARLWGFGPAVTYREELKEKLPAGIGVAPSQQRFSRADPTRFTCLDST